MGKRLDSRRLLSGVGVVGVAVAVVLTGCSQSVSEPERAAGGEQSVGVDLSSLSQGQQNSIGNASNGFATPLSPECQKWAKSRSDSKGFRQCAEVADAGLVGFSKWNADDPGALGAWGPIRMEMTKNTIPTSSGAAIATFPNYVEGSTSFQFGTYFPKDSRSGEVTLTAVKTAGVPTPLAGSSVKFNHMGGCEGGDEYYVCEADPYNLTYLSMSPGKWMDVGQQGLQSAWVSGVRTLPTVFEFRSMSDTEWEVNNESTSGFLRDKNGERGRSGAVVPGMLQDDDTYDVNASLSRAGYRSKDGTKFYAELKDSSTGGRAIVDVKIPKGSSALSPSQFSDKACQVTKAPSSDSGMHCEIVVTQGAVQTVSFVLTGGQKLAAATPKKQAQQPVASSATPVPVAGAPVTDWDGTCGNPDWSISSYAACFQFFNQGVYDATNLNNPLELTIRAMTANYQGSIPEQPGWDSLKWAETSAWTNATNYSSTSTQKPMSYKSGLVLNLHYPGASLQMAMRSPAGGSQLVPGGRSATATMVSSPEKNINVCLNSTFVGCVDHTTKGSNPTYVSPKQGAVTYPVRIQLTNQTKDRYRYLDNAAVTGNFLSSYAMSAPTLVEDPVLSAQETGTVGGWAAAAPTGGFGVDRPSTFSTTLVAESGSAQGSLVTVNIVISGSGSNRKINDSSCTVVSPGSVSPRCVIDTSTEDFSLNDRGFSIVNVRIR